MQCVLYFHIIGKFPHLLDYVLVKSNYPYHHIELYRHIGLYALGCLDVYSFPIFHKLYLGSVDPIQMINYWPYSVQFGSNSLPCLRRKFITGQNYPYDKIKWLELCEWAASQIFSLNIGQDIVNMIREVHWIFLIWNLKLHWLIHDEWMD